jgi:REP element-mobilizing transposase RayT
MGLGLLVGRFKMRSARRINALRGVEGVPLWQRNYYEHVIRDEQECQQCCEYILNNPGRWSEDHEHPDRWSPRLGAERT